MNWVVVMLHVEIHCCDENNCIQCRDCLVAKDGHERDNQGLLMLHYLACATVVTSFTLFDSGAVNMY